MGPWPSISARPPSPPSNWREAATGSSCAASTRPPLPDGLVVDGEIVDADLFGRELKAFVNQNGLRGRSTQVGVSNQKVIVRNIDMPEMTEAELVGAIEYQAQDYIPIPVEDAVLDFQILGRHDRSPKASPGRKCFWWPPSGR